MISNICRALAQVAFSGLLLGIFLSPADSRALDAAVLPNDAAHTNAAKTSLGASWPETFEKRRDWWSFKPLRKPAPPVVSNREWNEHPVDRFLFEKISLKQLSPSAPADRRTLLRRAAFLLTGLPPQPADLRSFLDDSSPDAFAKVVNRLLDSPGFGEHWARHWMDLMRFAETHGSEGDPDIPSAWRYRDYLIRAFNQDVPWDQLIREHVAGDLLPEPRWNQAEQISESILGIAHFRLVEHGFNPVDTLEEQIKTVDSQIDVIAKAFQGLTVSCARCHDHKFDPISQRDYYALYGVLASIRPSQIAIDTPARLRAQRAELETLKVEIRSKLALSWLSAVEGVVQDLAREQGPSLPGDELAQEIFALEKQIRQIEQKRFSQLPSGQPLPISAWTFDDARDSVGVAHGVLHGGATLRDGKLVLNGEDSFFQAGNLGTTLRAKTLEAWVRPAQLEQRGGGVLTLEARDGQIFDSIVFAEKDPGRWMAGSEFLRRSGHARGPVETSTGWVHVAIAYETNNSIGIYRNGQACAPVFTPSGEGSALQTFEAANSRVLIGKRHTGGGSPFFAGEIDEARLYDRALAQKEVQASFEKGPGAKDLAPVALTPEQASELRELNIKLHALRERLAVEFPAYAKLSGERSRRQTQIASAEKDEKHPLALLTKKEPPSAVTTATVPRWNFQTTASDWFAYGINPPEYCPEGEFMIEPNGERILTGLIPAGVYSHRLSQKHSGVFASPRFRIESDSLSAKVTGGKGARVRVIPDNYPIGQGGIFPQAALSSDAPTWVRLDTAYRRGSMAYLELATLEEVTSRDRPKPNSDGRSFFGIEKVIFHDRPLPPDAAPFAHALPSEFFSSSRAIRAQQIGVVLRSAIEAWREGQIEEAHRAWLDAFVRSGLLPSRLQELPNVAPLVARYREIEASIPEPRRAPGVLEADAGDAPLLIRGDHKKPGELVPRGYLRLLSPDNYHTARSGRLELARDLVSSGNPLTARVMANRVWHYLFGRGLVPSVDNFGLLGDRPTHPELLDYLAATLVENGWSAKKLIRHIMLSRAFQMSSEPSARAAEIDPVNEFLSHMRLQRLPAEAIRDSMLAISGGLDSKMHGPGADALAPPSEQKRRSVYLTIRRNFLNPLLETFDAPRPFSTLGKRETSNVPAQSLALLNDPFVTEQARRWAVSMGAGTDDQARISEMFEAALSRPPRGEELASSVQHLAFLRGQPDRTETQAWADFAQSIFNLKEFIYIR